MLDMIMAGFGMVALWQFAAALRDLTARRARWRLALCGVCLGLALGAKWSVAPVALLPGLAFLVAAPARPRLARIHGAATRGRCRASR